MIRAIRNGIYEDTGLMVVDTDSNYSKTDYPFYSYKVLSIIQETNQRGAIDIEGTMTLDSKFIISFNSYSEKLEESLEKAILLWEWFKHRGKPYLSTQNIVVVRVGTIQDRTIYIADKFEYRQGFDVELRILHKIDRKEDYIETWEVEQLREDK